MSEADLRVESTFSTPDFLTGGGEMGARIRAHDWASTPLGPIEAWPQSLRSALSICLGSSFPTAIYWGPELRLLYNDAWAPIPADRHPWALGRPGADVWADIWSVIGPQLERVTATGEGFSVLDQMLPMERNGVAHETYWNYSFTPIRGEDGQLVGVFNQGNETTERIMTERRLRDSEARLSAVLESVSDCFYAVDRDWRYVVFNRASERYFGVSRDKVIGRKLWDLFPQGRGTEFERLCRAAMDEGVSATIETPSKLRSDRFVELRVAPMDGGGVAVSISDITDRKTSEAQLRESEARFRNMADHAPVMMWVTDPSGYCTYLNPAWYKFTGQSEGEAEGYGWLEATHPDDKAQADEAFRSANAAQQPFRVEYRLRRADGTYRWAIDAAAPRFGDDGAYLGYVGSVIDIDERREAEDRQRDSEARLRTLTNALPAFVWFATPDGALHHFNDRWYEYTGQTPDEALADGWTAMLHPDDVERTAALWDDTRAQGVTYESECRYRRHDGAYRWYVARAEPIRDATGIVVGWVGTSTDIDDRKRAEAALAARNREFERVMLAAPAAIYINDRLAKRSVYVNEGVSRILGYTADDVAAFPPGELMGLVHPDDVPVVDDLLARVEGLADGAAAEAEYRLRRKDGAYIWLHDRMVVLDRDARGVAHHVLGFSVDVTHRRQAEDHQRLLINELNHRVKNTLAIVQGIAQQSFRGVPVASQARMAFEGRLAALSAAHNILTRVNWDAVSIVEIVTQAVEPYRSRADAFEIEGPDVALAPKTAVSLALAVHELATNAVKYGALSTPAGRVEIRWRTEEGRLKLIWRERGGPPVEAPTKRGFGSRMIERGLAAELGGDVKIEFDRQGVVCAIDAPLPDARA